LLSRILGAFLFAYPGEPPLQGAADHRDCAHGRGALCLFAGVFGVGGAVRGAFLAAYDLPKDVYIFTAGAIGLVVDTGRLTTYWSQGAQLDHRLLWALLLFVPVSFAGAKAAGRIVQRIPQERFRAVVAAFPALIALKLLVLPSEGQPEQGSRASASPGAQPQLPQRRRRDRERSPMSAASTPLRDKAAADRVGLRAWRDPPHDAGIKPVPGAEYGA